MAVVPRSQFDLQEQCSRQHKERDALLRKNYWKPVTAVLGFVNGAVHKDGDMIVMASDSQMSAYPYSTARQVGYPKLGKIAFKGEKHHAMIAKAGTLMTANHFEELFAREAAEVIPKTPWSIAEVAERAMKQVRSKIMGVFTEAAPWSDDTKAQRMRDYHCEIMLAYFFDGIPHIYVMTSDACFPDPQKQPFAAVGCAANVVSSVLSGFGLKEMKPDNALALSVYAIEMCKKNDLACGGDVQLGVISCYSDQPAFFFQDKDVNLAYAESALKTMEQAREFLTTKLVENFREIRLGQNGVFWLK